MGHLPIVNQETVEYMIMKGCICTRGDLKSKWIQTTSDIFSDVLATREGDLVFPWIVKGNASGNLGFKYQFKISGKPFFAKGEEYPVCIPLERTGLEYENPLSESEALDLWGRELLWNVIGKKSLRWGRSLTHQTPMEDKKMIELLDDKNPQGPKEIRLGKCIPGGTPITISALQDKLDPKLKQVLGSISAENRLSNLDLSGIPWRKGKLFSTEKTLEAWIMENIDKPETRTFKEQLFLEVFPITWFANYLPFGVQGSNIDVVILQEDAKRKIVNIVELKKGSLSKNKYEEAANKAINYALFIERAFNSFGIKVKLNVGVLSGSSSPRSSIRPVERGGLSTKWITYEIDSQGSLTFGRLL